MWAESATAKRWLSNLAMRGRVVLCGAISLYNESELAPGPSSYINLIIRRGRMEGFIVLDYMDRFSEGQMEMAGGVMNGQIQHAEHVVEGLEQAPMALNLLFSVGNTGKLIVKL